MSLQLNSLQCIVVKQKPIATVKQKPIATVKQTPNTIKKKPQRRWTESEVEKVFAYLKETISLNMIIEKPNANDYYTRLIRVKGLENCTPTVVRDKVKHLQKKYKDAIKWRDETGQGIRDTDGETTFEHLMMQRYPNFGHAQEIWGCKVSIHVPYIATSGQIGPVSERSLVPVSTTLSGLAHSNASTTNSAVTIEEMEMDIGVEPMLTLPKNDSEAKSPGVIAASSKLFSKAGLQIGAGDSPPLARNAREAYKEVSNLRFACTQEKLSYQKQQLQLENKKFEADLEFRSQEFQFKKSAHESELAFKSAEIQAQLRMKEIDSAKEIRLKELEVEKLKLEIELLKEKTANNLS